MIKVISILIIIIMISIFSCDYCKDFKVSFMISHDSSIEIITANLYNDNIDLDSGMLSNDVIENLWLLISTETTDWNIWAEHVDCGMYQLAIDIVTSDGKRLTKTKNFQVTGPGGFSVDLKDFN